MITMDSNAVVFFVFLIPYISTTQTITTSTIKTNEEDLGCDDDSDPQTHLLHSPAVKTAIGINLVSPAFLLYPEASFEPIDSQKIRQSARRQRSQPEMKGPHGTLRRYNRKVASSPSSGRSLSVVFMAAGLLGCQSLQI